VRCTYKIVVEKLEWKRPFGRLVKRWKDIKMNSYEMQGGRVYFNDNMLLKQDLARWSLLIIEHQNNVGTQNFRHI
jgi:c-di-GMP-related signal transduction protein